MKVSIAWVFDHIAADWHRIDIESLVEKFNQTTAEIEGWYPVSLDPKKFCIAQAVSQKKCQVAQPKKEVALCARADVQPGYWYILKKEGTSYAWATSVDMGAEKEMLLPAIDPESWKDGFEASDYILEVDNKSITHRPDLWGHRGFAREIAALLNLKLKPYDTFLARKSIKESARKANQKEGPSLAIEDPHNCTRLAGLFIPDVTPTASLAWMVSRLSRVDSRAINALVDCTNYVMLDTSQPMHAFDASQIDQTLVARQARSKEKLALLDGQELTLSNTDIVIADAKKAVSLAGIMGGKSSGIAEGTHMLFLESANFNATTIRRSSQRYHVRTESSARFEKSLDPMQNVDAILRYLKLLDDAKISYTAAPHIMSLGKTFKPPVVKLSHRFITDRLGVDVSAAFIIKTLEKIGFTVTKKEKKSDTDYTVTVPLFRATKDIALPEDIVEEVARFYGYHNIPFVFPERPTQPVDTRVGMQEYTIKRQLAFGCAMHELYSYAFFDESFIRTLGWEPPKTLQVVAPVSQNWYRLATTLMPHMIKAVVDNAHDNDQLRFFEWGRVWHHDKKTVREEKKLTGVWYKKREAVNFYDVKTELERLFAMLSLPVEWRSHTSEYPWLNKSQTAQLWHDETVIGIVGMADTAFMKSHAEGSACLFELDAAFLAHYQAPEKRFVPRSKYPAVARDISMLIARNVTVAQLMHTIKKAHKLIAAVELIDLFEKKEWKDKKAITVRYIMQDPEKTLTGPEADRMSKEVAKAVTKLGATIR